MDCVHASGGQRSTSHVIPSVARSLSFVFLRQGLSLAWGWLTALCRLSGKPQDLPVSGILWSNTTIPSFVTWFLGSASSLHVYVENTVPTEQSPQPNFQARFSLFNSSILRVWVSEHYVSTWSSQRPKRASDPPETEMTDGSKSPGIKPGSSERRTKQPVLWTSSQTTFKHFQMKNFHIPGTRIPCLIKCACNGRLLWQLLLERDTHGSPCLRSLTPVQWHLCMWFTWLLNQQSQQLHWNHKTLSAENWPLRDDLTPYFSF